MPALTNLVHLQKATNFLKILLSASKKRFHFNCSFQEIIIEEINIDTHGSYLQKHVLKKQLL